jgi:hypothetical protein
MGIKDYVMKRRDLRRLVREHVRDAIDDHPDATGEQLYEIVEEDLKDEYGIDPVTLGILLQILIKLLPLILKLLKRD